ncbi:MAG: two-component system, NtrC family, sensor kinase [Chthoniobacter sp.]|jgi:PAS domain S-box-containing protein|nr:two-component system, NtrC family, sensor kinase [Chthoniobacter sp.]
MKILIADDDHITRLLLRSALTKLGHEVQEATNGREAWEAWHGGEFPFIISDWMMPDLDGLEFCRRIRAEPRADYPYIVLLTSRSGNSNYLEAMTAGADDFVTKPYEKDAFAARVRAAERILGLHAKLRAANLDLERRVGERTAELETALRAKGEFLSLVSEANSNLEQRVQQRTRDLENEVKEHHRTSEERDRFFTASLDLLCIAGVDGLFRRVNPAFQLLLGWTPGELLSRPFLDFFHPDDRPSVARQIELQSHWPMTMKFEVRLLCKDGAFRWIEWSASPPDEAGLFCPCGRDVTERKHAEEQRCLMEVQLRHAQKMESIGQLAAGVAHEINTPTQYIGDNMRFVQDAFRDLAGLLGAQQRLLAAAKGGSITPELIAEVEQAAVTADLEYLSVEVPKALDQALDGVRKVSKIVGALKEFSHPGGHEKTPTDLNHAIQSTITVATNEWKYVAEIVTDLAPDLPLVPCLPDEFNQVILNMVVNASHAIGDVIGDGTKGRGTITITTRLDADAVEIRLRDTGTGIPERVRARIFDPFFTTKGVGRGTGQGLAIAHAVIVDKHGGSIQVESEVGLGSTFILRLPIRPLPAERLAA